MPPTWTRTRQSSSSVQTHGELKESGKFGGLPPVLGCKHAHTLNMVQMRARSCIVLAVRVSVPSTLLSCSLTSMGPVSVRRGPLFQTMMSLLVGS